MLDRIHIEHGNINLLLEILLQKARLVEDGGKIDYHLIQDIIHYLQYQADRYHHPKEDILYHYYLAHYGENQSIKNLEQEHIELTQLTAEFADIVDMILLDSVIPQEIFLQKLHNFAMRQKAHLQLEEREIFPRLRRDFSLYDWRCVSEQYQDDIDDPLFGRKVADRYRNLHNYIDI